MNRRGFTLMEVIISMTLMSLLMVLVWSLFSTYTRLEERSSRTATELQLVRSVSRQLRSDLEHFAVLPLPPGDLLRPEGTGAAGNSGSEDGTSTSNGENSSNETESDSDDTDDNDSDSGNTVQQNEADTDEQSDPTDSANAASSGTASAGAISPTPAVNLVDTDFTESDVFTTNTFDASLPDLTYLRGSANRLEIVTRLPYTVDVPSNQQLIGAETRYGTHHLVIYEFRNPRELETLLNDDPVLNPSKFNPPVPAPTTLVPNNPNQPLIPPQVATPLNPNDNVGLIRESKSWLHVTRDQRREALTRTAEAAGLLVNGQLPTIDQRRPDDLRRQRPDQSLLDSSTSNTPPWAPPPEFRHRKDHIPEVTKLQFRYFDGTEWKLNWTQNEFLPRAVEVAFDLDPDAPAVRAREFEDAHALVLAGQSVTDVLPPEETTETEDADLAFGLDSLSTVNLADPTAIVTEYRFVIQLPTGRKKKDNDERDQRASSMDDAQGDSLLQPVRSLPGSEL